MASQFPPKKNTAFTLFFSLYKNDGTIIADPGIYTKKVSIDGGAIADIVAAVTEENTTYGQLSVVLSAAEMNGDAIWIYIVDDTAGCVPFTATIYTAASTQDELALAPETGTVVADASNSIISFKTDLASTTDSYCVGSFVKFTSGVLINQVRKISGFGGTSKLMLVTSGFTAIPTAGDRFIVINQ